MNCQHCNGSMKQVSCVDGITTYRCPLCYGNPTPPNLIVGYELRSPDAKCPTYAHDGDAGADLYAVSFENVAWPEPFNECPPPCEMNSAAWKDVVKLHPGRCVLVHTELSMVLPKGWEASIRGRSGWAFKHGVTILHIGTGDAGFTGTYDVILKNNSARAVEIKPGDRIAQVVFSEVGRAAFRRQEMPETARGQNGYGSSGS